MRRPNPKLALLLGAIAATCAGAAAVYATAGSTAGSSGGAATATATPAHVERSLSGSTCAISAPQCNDVVHEPGLTCEEAHACAIPTLPDVVCEGAEACPPGRRICPGPTLGPETPGATGNTIPICAAPCVHCPVACPAMAPNAPTQPGSASDHACPIPICPDATPVSATPAAAPSIAPLCGPIPCAALASRCQHPVPCTVPEGTSGATPDCQNNVICDPAQPEGAPQATPTIVNVCVPPPCLPVAPAPSPPGGPEPQTSNQACPAPLPPDCAISSDGAVSCPTPGATGGTGGAGSAPGSTDAATPSIRE